jgi:hypothetical protein
MDEQRRPCRRHGPEVGAGITQGDQAAVHGVPPHLGAETPRVEPRRLDPRCDEHIGDRVAGQELADGRKIPVVKQTGRRGPQR